MNNPLGITLLKFSWLQAGDIQRVAAADYTLASTGWRGSSRGYHTLCTGEQIANSFAGFSMKYLQTFHYPTNPSKPTTQIAQYRRRVAETGIASVIDLTESPALIVSDRNMFRIETKGECRTEAQHVPSIIGYYVILHFQRLYILQLLLETSIVLHQTPVNSHPSQDGRQSLSFSSGSPD